MSSRAPLPVFPSAPERYDRTNEAHFRAAVAQAVQEALSRIFAVTAEGQKGETIVGGVPLVVTVPNATATTIYTFPATVAVWLVSLTGRGGVAHAGFAVVAHMSSGALGVLGSHLSNVTLSVSGTNLQLTQNNGTPVMYDVRVIRTLAGTV